MQPRIPDGVWSLIPDVAHSGVSKVNLPGIFCPLKGPLGVENPNMGMYSCLWGAAGVPGMLKSLPPGFSNLCLAHMYARR